MKVLIVDDNKILNNNISKYLEINDIASKQVFSWEKVLHYLSLENFDAIILDIWLPDISWIEVCKRVRESWKSIPIIFLTARDSINDKVKWLNIWADDYLTKPFDYEELIARLNSLVRRDYSQKSENIKIWELEINTNNNLVLYKNIEIKLSKLEYDLLLYLSHNKWKIVSKEELIEKVWWEYDAFSNSRTVDVYIWYLRKKITKGLVKTKRWIWYIIN